MTQNFEQSPQEKDGIRWLRMLGREDLIGTDFTTKDGRQLLAEDFTQACPDEAVNILTVLEQLGPDDPMYQQNVPAVKHIVESYFGAATLTNN